MPTLRVAGTDLSFEGVGTRHVAALARTLQTADADGERLLRRDMDEVGDLTVASVTAEKTFVIAEAARFGDQIRGIKAATRNCVLAIAAFLVLSASLTAAQGFKLVEHHEVVRTVLFGMSLGMFACVVIPLAMLIPVVYSCGAIDPGNLIEASASKVIAGRDRVYHLRPDVQGALSIRHMHFDAIGDCYADGGSIEIRDLVGHTLVKLQGVDMEAANGFVEYVTRRSAATRAARQPE